MKIHNTYLVSGFFFSKICVYIQISVTNLNKKPIDGPGAIENLI